MATYFKDSSGTSWELAVTLGNAIKVKERLGIDILQPEQGETPLYQKISEDDTILAQIIAVLIENQFDKNGVTEENIYDRFDGSTVSASITALNKELHDFFLQRGRPDRAKQIKKTQELLEVGIKVREEQIDKVPMEKLFEKIRADADQAFMNSVGTLEA